MTTRKLFTATLAALLLAAPVAASAATARHPHHAARHPHRATVVHTGRHAPARPAAAPRDGGSAAVDALNQQSLNNARGGTAPAAQ